MHLSSSQAIDSTFGRGFYEALIELPENVWVGPVQSGYGAHLVRLTDGKEPALPPFEAIREQVLTDWRRDQTDRLTAAQLDAFRAKYEIETPPSEALAKWAVN